MFRKQWLLVTVAVLLASCGTLAPRGPSPDPLPPLVESALGREPTLAGTAENWTGEQDVDLAVGQQAVGQLRPGGAFKAVLPEPDGAGNDPVFALGYSLSSYASSRCSQDQVFLSDPAAKVVAWRALRLQQRAGSVQPQTSPPPSEPELIRQRYDERARTNTQTVLVHADRDTLVRAQKSCLYRPYGAPKNTEYGLALALHLQLRQGWNTVTVTERYGEGGTWSTVYGGEPAPPVAWKYNGVPLP